MLGGKTAPGAPATADPHVDRPRAGRPLRGDRQPAAFGARDAGDQPPRGHRHRHGPVGADLSRRIWVPRSCSRSRRTSRSRSPPPWPSPMGVVFRSELQRTADQPPDDLEAYACTLRFYVYRAEPSPESHALLREVPGARGGPLPGLRHGVGDAVAGRAGRGSIRFQSADPACPVRSSGHCRRHVGPSTSTPTTPAACRP